MVPLWEPDTLPWWLSLSGAAALTAFLLLENRAARGRLYFARFMAWLGFRLPKGAAA